jgi:hypothetical protein
MKAAVVILLLLSAVGAAPPDVHGQGRARSIQARGRGRNLLLTERGGARTLLRVSEYVDAARITDASVIFESRTPVFVYLLLDICGPSKAQPDDRQCGAGTECSLLWLKLDSRRRIMAGDSARYESCWAPITTDDDGFRITGRTLRVVIKDFREDLEYTVTYDADRPEQGLRKQQSPLPSGDR